MRSLANAWMESKDPYMLISTSSIGVRDGGVTNLDVRGTDRGPSTVASLCEATTRSG